MKIAIVGLGKMGGPIARKLAEDGHEVVALDRSEELIAEAVSHGAQAARSREDVKAAFGDQPANIWLMIPSDFVDEELDAWLPLLPESSVVIDGGNSDFRLTRERATRAAEKGVHFLDVGTSGGIWGYEKGFCMMAGGEETAFKQVEPVLETLAKPNAAYRYFGPSGSGHYVKMVHNAVEYGMMQALAEGYRMLEEGDYKGQIDLAVAGDVWQHGSVIESWLNELTRQAVEENPKLDGIDGFVAESGETRWTLEAAKALNIVLPVTQASFDVRLASQKGETNFATKLLAAMRNKFGGHQINK